MSNDTHRGTSRDVEAQRPLRSVVEPIGETIKERQEKIRHLQKEVFQLANYYFVFQGVIFTAFYNTQSHGKCEYRWIPFTLSFLAGFVNLCSLLAIASTYRTTLDEIDKLAAASLPGSGGTGDGGTPIAVKCASNWRLLYVTVCMLCVTAFFVITLVGCLTITCSGDTPNSAATASPTAG